MECEKNKIANFHEYYERHKKSVYNYALKLLKNDDVAKDVTHNVFLKLFDNLALIRDKTKITAWIFATARNEIYGELRGAKKFAVDFDEATRFLQADYERYNPESDAEKNDLKSIIETELENFSEINREIFVLREYAGLSYKEIAETLNLETEKIKSRLFKIRKKLIERISKLI